MYTGIVCLINEFHKVLTYYVVSTYNFYIDLSTKENYEMVEPQPLRIHNVMFCFICLALGISLAVTIAVLELLRKKLWKKQEQVTSTRIQEEKESESKRVWNREKNLGELTEIELK